MLILNGIEHFVENVTFATAPFPTMFSKVIYYRGVYVVMLNNMCEIKYSNTWIKKKCNIKSSPDDLPVLSCLQAFKTSFFMLTFK